MGRHKTSEVYSYFTVSAGKATCKLYGCNMVIKYASSCNLKKHLERHHQQEYSSLVKKEATLPNKRPLMQDSESSSAKRTKTIQDILCPTVNIRMDQKTFYDAMIELVTLNGRPFSAVEDSGLCKIIDPIKKSLNITMDRKKISKLVDERAIDIRKRISEELQGRFFSLKLDIASRLDRSVLAINAQFIDKDSLQIRTLAVTELTRAHTGEYIKEVVLSVLDRYSLSANQVYTITTDNARNMIKAVENMSNESDSLIDFDDSSVEIEVMMQNVLSIKCAAHTLQLAVKEALSSGLCLNSISHTRKLAKKLRTPTIIAILKTNGYNVPLVDVVTRWCSTYDMISRLLELRPFVEDYIEIIGKDLKLSQLTWEKLEEVKRSLQPAKKATLQLQEENLTPGDFYKVWFKCKSETSKQQCLLASHIVDAMKKREKDLFQNTALVSSLYLDPRFSVLLTENEQEQAVKHLIRLHEKVSSLYSNSKTDEVSESSQELPSTPNALHDDLENMLQAVSKSRTNLRDATRNGVFSSLKEFSNVERIPVNSNIIHWWNTMKLKYPEIYKLSLIVHGIPVTQVSVERIFSIFKLVLSPQRNSLLPSNTENIIFVRANFNL